jgi:hypothetical protein
MIGMIGSLVFMYYQKLAHGHQQDKVTLCHHTESRTNPWVLQEVNANEVKSHIDNGDMLIDKEHPCPPVVSPSPTPSSSPTATPHPTSDPCANLNLDIAELSRDHLCPSASPSVSPSASPSSSDAGIDGSKAPEPNGIDCTKNDCSVHPTATYPASPFDGSKVGWK